MVIIINFLVIFVKAALLNMTGCAFIFTGLGFLKDAGLFQMLGVSNIVFCALLSIPLLKKVDIIFIEERPCLELPRIPLRLPQ